MRSSIRMRSLGILALLSLAGCAGRGHAASDPDQPLAAAAAAAAASPALDARMGLVRDPRLAEALTAISPSRLRAIDSALVSFGTRHTMSDTLSATRGIGAARRWIHAELSRYAAACGGCLRVEYDAAPVVVERHPQRPTVNVVNVLAWLPGRDTTRVVVMGGHYDSCICSIDSFDATSDAPGADDDGSGTTAVMELARVMSERFPRGFDATIVFALYSGEELGLLGSRHLAARLHAGGYRVAAAFTDDIVGNVVAENGATDSTSLRVFAADPDWGPSRELGRYVVALGGIYVPSLTLVPVWRLDRVGRGGDHRPFVDLGDPGLRFTERLENYKRQHLPTDDLAHVNFGYVAQVARVNAAAVGALALAPPPPDSAVARRDAASGGQRWALHWQRAPGAVGYEVLVRRTTSPVWERVVAVGDTTRHLLDAQLDDAWAGIRSIGPRGERSLAVSVPAQRFVAR